MQQLTAEFDSGGDHGERVSGPVANLAVESGLLRRLSVDGDRFVSESGALLRVSGCVTLSVSGENGADGRRASSLTLTLAATRVDRMRRSERERREWSGRSKSLLAHARSYTGVCVHSDSDNAEMQAKRKSRVVGGLIIGSARHDSVSEECRARREGKVFTRSGRAGRASMRRVTVT